MYIVDHREAMAADPEWQARHAEMIKNRSANQAWRQKQAEALRMACAANKAKAAKRDALCSPEERERRERRRARVQRHREKLKARSEGH